MIDDDFESMFRRMIEDFMETFGGIPGGSVKIRSWNGSIVNEPLETLIGPSMDEPRVEKIDLGDSMLILIEDQTVIETQQVKVSGSTISLQFSPEQKKLDIDVGFRINPDKSNATHRNGVLEITAVKASDESPSRKDGLIEIK